jgi:hypothetical protein
VVELTVPYSSTQNGVAERLNPTLVEHSQSMLIGANLPLFLWLEAINYACYLKNILPTHALNANITPEEAFFGRKPNVANVHKFGAHIWVLCQGGTINKLESKAKKFCFVGLSDWLRGYWYWNHGGQAIQILRNVIFRDPKTIEDDYIVPTPFPSLSEEEPVPTQPTMETLPAAILPTLPASKVVRLPDSPPLPPLPPSPSTPERKLLPLTQFLTLATTTPPRSARLLTPQALRKAARNISSAIDPSNIIEGGRTQLQKSNFALLSHTTTVTIDDDLKTVAEACARPDWPQWQAAMQVKYNQYATLGTWQLTELPCNWKAIPSKWVFKLKRDANGKVIKHKAQLIIKGFLQIPGIDFIKTFAPMVCLKSFCFLLALAACLQLKAHRMDVVGAYLNSTLNKTVYMRQPKAFDDKSECACLLKLCLYRLCQAGHNWNKTLDTTFKVLGYMWLIADQCVYVCRATSDASPTIVSVHVNNMTIFACTNRKLAKVKGELSSQFNVIDLGELAHVLGMRVTWDNEGLYRIHQTGYAERVLKSVGIKDCNAVSTPLDPNVKLMLLTPNDPRVQDDVLQHEYLSGLGKVMYLTIATCLDLAYTIQHLSQFS